MRWVDRQTGRHMQRICNISKERQICRKEGRQTRRETDRQMGTDIHKTRTWIQKNINRAVDTVTEIQR